MRNKSTLEKQEYVLDSIYWFTLVFLLYRNLFFCPVFTLDYTRSTILLVCTAIFNFAVGILLTYKRRRNYVSIFCNAVLSISSYFIISFWNITRTALTIAATTVKLKINFCRLINLRTNKNSGKALHCENFTNKPCRSCYL